MSKGTPPRTKFPSRFDRRRNMVSETPKDQQPMSHWTSVKKNETGSRFVEGVRGLRTADGREESSKKDSSGSTTGFSERLASIKESSQEQVPNLRISPRANSLTPMTSRAVGSMSETEVRSLIDDLRNGSHRIIEGKSNAARSLLKNNRGETGYAKRASDYLFGLAMSSDIPDLQANQKSINKLNEKIEELNEQANQQKTYTQARQEGRKNEQENAANKAIDVAITRRAEKIGKRDEKTQELLKNFHQNTRDPQLKNLYKVLRINQWLKNYLDTDSPYISTQATQDTLREEIKEFESFFEGETLSGEYELEMREAQSKLILQKLEVHQARGPQDAINKSFVDVLLKVTKKPIKQACEERIRKEEEAQQERIARQRELVRNVSSLRADVAREKEKLAEAVYKIVASASSEENKAALKKINKDLEEFFGRFFGEGLVFCEDKINALLGVDKKQQNEEWIKSRDSLKEEVAGRILNLRGIINHERTDLKDLYETFLISKFIERRYLKHSHATKDIVAELITGHFEKKPLTLAGNLPQEFADDRAQALYQQLTQNFKDRAVLASFLQVSEEEKNEALARLNPSTLLKNSSQKAYASQTPTRPINQTPTPNFRGQFSARRSGGRTGTSGTASKYPPKESKFEEALTNLVTPQIFKAATNAYDNEIIQKIEGWEVVSKMSNELILSQKNLQKLGFLNLTILDEGTLREDSENSAFIKVVQDFYQKEKDKRSAWEQKAIAAIFENGNFTDEFKDGLLNFVGDQIQRIAQEVERLESETQQAKNFIERKDRLLKAIQELRKNNQGVDNINATLNYLVDSQSTALEKNSFHYLVSEEVSTASYLQAINQSLKEEEDLKEFVELIVIAGERIESAKIENIKREEESRRKAEAEKLKADELERQISSNKRELDEQKEIASKELYKALEFLRGESELSRDEKELLIRGLFNYLYEEEEEEEEKSDIALELNNLQSFASPKVMEALLLLNSGADRRSIAGFIEGLVETAYVVSTRYENLSSETESKLKYIKGFRDGFLEKSSELESSMKTFKENKKRDEERLRLEEKERKAKELADEIGNFTAKKNSLKKEVEDIKASKLTKKTGSGMFAAEEDLYNKVAGRYLPLDKKDEVGDEGLKLIEKFLENERLNIIAVGAEKPRNSSLNSPFKNSAAGLASKNAGWVLQVWIKETEIGIIDLFLEGLRKEENTLHDKKERLKKIEKLKSKRAKFVAEFKRIGSAEYQDLFEVDQEIERLKNNISALEEFAEKEYRNKPQQEKTKRPTTTGSVDSETIYSRHTPNAWSRIQRIVNDLENEDKEFFKKSVLNELEEGEAFLIKERNQPSPYRFLQEALILRRVMREALLLEEVDQEIVERYTSSITTLDEQVLHLLKEEIMQAVEKSSLNITKKDRIKEARHYRNLFKASLIALRELEDDERFSNEEFWKLDELTTQALALYVRQLVEGNENTVLNADLQTLLTDLDQAQNLKEASSILQEISGKSGAKVSGLIEEILESEDFIKLAKIEELQKVDGSQTERTNDYSENFEDLSRDVSRQSSRAGLRGLRPSSAQSGISEITDHSAKWRVPNSRQSSRRGSIAPTEYSADNDWDSRPASSEAKSKIISKIVESLDEEDKKQYGRVKDKNSLVEQLRVLRGYVSGGLKKRKRGGCYSTETLSIIDEEILNEFKEAARKKLPETQFRRIARSENIVEFCSNLQTIIEEEKDLGGDEETLEALISILDDAISNQFYSEYEPDLDEKKKNNLKRNAKPKSLSDLRKKLVRFNEIIEEIEGNGGSDDEEKSNSSNEGSGDSVLKKIIKRVTGSSPIKKPKQFGGGNGGGSDSRRSSFSGFSSDEENNPIRLFDDGEEKHDSDGRDLRSLIEDLRNKIQFLTKQSVEDRENHEASIRSFGETIESLKKDLREKKLRDEEGKSDYSDMDRKDDLQKQIDELQEKLREEKERAQKKEFELEKERLVFSEKLSELQKNYSSSQNSFSEKITRFTSLVDSKNTEISHFQTALKSLEKERSSQDTQIQNIQKKLKEKKDSSEKSIEDLKQRIEQQEREKLELANRLNALERQESDENTTVVFDDKELRKEITKLKTALNQRNSEIDALKNSLSEEGRKRESEIRLTQDRLQILEQEKAEANAKHESVLASLKSLEKEKAASKNQIEELRQKHEVQAAEFQTLNEQVQQYQENLNRLTQQNSDQNKVIEELRQTIAGLSVVEQDERVEILENQIAQLQDALDELFEAQQNSDQAEVIEQLQETIEQLRKNIEELPDNQQGDRVEYLENKVGELENFLTELLQQNLDQRSEGFNYSANYDERPEMAKIEFDEESQIKFKNKGSKKIGSENLTILKPILKGFEQDYGSKFNFTAIGEVAKKTDDEKIEFIKDILEASRESAEIDEREASIAMLLSIKYGGLSVSSSDPDVAKKWQEPIKEDLKEILNLNEDEEVQDEEVEEVFEKMLNFSRAFSAITKANGLYTGEPAKIDQAVKKNDLKSLTSLRLKRLPVSFSRDLWSAQEQGDNLEEWQEMCETIGLTNAELATPVPDYPPVEVNLREGSIALRPSSERGK
jgi:hypothetical protein